MNFSELSTLLRTAVEVGATNVLTANAILSDDISKAEAYKIYGRNNIDRWSAEGLISFSPCKHNPQKPLVNRKKLEAVAANSNRITYLPVVER